VKDLPDQAVALVATAWVERNLERVIRSRMVRLTKTRYRELFVALGPLASLSAKTKLAYAMRIVGRTGVTDLDLIREIRNQFAHSFHPLTFRTREIAKACRRLRTPEAGAKSMTRKEKDQFGFKPSTDAAHDPKTRFVVACLFISAALAVPDFHGPRPPRTRSRISRGILH